MYVVKRDGWLETLHFDKITSSLKKLSAGLNSYHCDHVLITKKVCSCLYNGITTNQIYELAAETCASMTCYHPHYDSLACRIALSNLHKNTQDSFSKTVEYMFNEASLIAEDVLEIVSKNCVHLDSEIMHGRDFDYDYFGLKTLERLYLSKVNGKVVERPQHMLMRVAVGIHKEDIDSVIKTYHMMSQRWFSHSSPTLLNAGTPRPQLSSCFVISMKDDSIKGIYNTLDECSILGKRSASIGISVHNICCTNVISQMMSDFKSTFDQRGANGEGGLAVYLEPWHANIVEFLQLRKSHIKDEEEKEENLYYGLWVPDLLMERVTNDGEWSLFCPNEAPGLADCCGEEFERLYTKYEKDGKAKKVVPAMELWYDILKSQIETGMPHMLFKDSCNKKSNQKNLGTISSSSLCSAVIEYTSSTETAVCNLASIALPRFVRDKDVSLDSHSSDLAGSLRSKNRYFDFDKLAEVTVAVTIDLNRIIDGNYYPVETARTSNKRNRPIGIGVQGLADAFILLGMSFDSPEAIQLNKDIFETIYYHALKTSSELAARDGTYETYKGSPISKGILQPDMWNVTTSNRWDWYFLRDIISKNGVRNSLLVSLMSTGSTSQILGNNESFEPYTSNIIYTNKALSGEKVIVNKHLLRDLTDMGLWTPTLKDKFLSGNGSIGYVTEIPDDLKEIYRTVWEIKQNTLVDMAADRGCYIDQSQSLNIHIEDLNYEKLDALHFYTWSQGLKTGMHCAWSHAI